MNLTAAQEAEMVDLALLMGLNILETASLPTAITITAQKVGITEDAVKQALRINAELRAYLAQACRKGAEVLRAAA